MPKFAVKSDGQMISANNMAGNDGVLVCCGCYKQVRFVRASNNNSAYFRHCIVNDSCRFSRGELPIDESSSINQINNKFGSMCDWHKQWQEIGRQLHPERYEAKGIGVDLNRPRDLGDTKTGVIVELQHSEITQAEFDTRNAGIAHAVWIFDATKVELFSYNKYAESVHFCVDTFRHTYNMSNTCTVLFHCSDGNMYEAESARPMLINIRDNTNVNKITKYYVRLLRRIKTNAHLDAFFGEGTWPLQKWDTMPLFQSAQVIEHPVQVQSEWGRAEIDKIHREFLCAFPQAPLTIVHAPPGAGKTTSLIQAIGAWGSKRVLVVTFGKSVVATMTARLREGGLAARADARTLDSLCYRACNKSDFDHVFSDKSFLEKHWPRTPWFKKRQFGGERSSNIVNFRLRHPYASIKTCDFHRRLTMWNDSNPWDASLDSFPIKQICDSNMTYAACRLACDRNNLLRSEFNKYDVVLVDEMQDLMSAQELRLLRQSSRPVVLVGDPMQAINAFRDDPPCANCTMQTEPVPTDLPIPIEWYGTWRLDPFTVEFIEEKFDRKMYSCRPTEENAEVYWQSDLRYPDKTLVLCRRHETAICLLDSFPGMKFVRGEEVAKSLKQAKDDKSQMLPMAKYAQSLPDEVFNRICYTLQANTIELCNLNGGAAVSVVHQVKGFEYDHCAIHEDLLHPETNIEQNISFVAFTRHLKSLVVLCDKPKIVTRQVEEAQRRKRKLEEVVQKNAELAAAAATQARLARKRQQGPCSCPRCEAIRLGLDNYECEGNCHISYIDPALVCTAHPFYYH